MVWGKRRAHSSARSTVRPALRLKTTVASWGILATPEGLIHTLQNMAITKMIPE